MRAFAETIPAKEAIMVLEEDYNAVAFRCVYPSGKRYFLESFAQLDEEYVMAAIEACTQLKSLFAFGKGEEQLICLSIMRTIFVLRRNAKLVQRRYVSLNKKIKSFDFGY